MVYSRAATQPRRRRARLIVLAVVVMLTAPAPAAAQQPLVPAAKASTMLPTAAASVGSPWQWPVVETIRVTSAWVSPEHDYGAGHRGVDLAAPAGATVVAPAGGTIAWVGTVVDRALLTIDHGNGYVTTLEPVLTSVTAGDAVMAGDAVGVVSAGGHTRAGSVHWGVRRDGQYVNPAMLLGSSAKPILLPCCEE